jgi:AcrR family transcriptional regulator
VDRVDRSAASVRRVSRIACSLASRLRERQRFLPRPRYWRGTGNLYHQFPDKESLFNTLLEQYWAALAQPDLPFNKALAEGAFPNNLEQLARGARASVNQYRRYVALIYVDVVEFEGTHIRRFYADMANRFQAFLEANRDHLALDRLRNGVPPLTAVMMASRFFIQYYGVELLFGVPNHFGVDDETALKQIVDIL